MASWRESKQESKRKCPDTHKSGKPRPVSAALLEDLRELDMPVEPQVYPPGTEFFHQGDLVREVYLIDRGMFKLVHSTEDGKEVIVGLRSAGWLLGAASLVLGVPASVKAVAVAESRLYRIPAELFRRLLSTDPYFSSYITKTFSREILDQTHQIVEMATFSPRCRLERLLRELIKDIESTTPRDAQTISRLHCTLAAQAMGDRTDTGHYANLSVPTPCPTGGGTYHR